MIGFAVISALATCLVGYLVLVPIFYYYYDPKGLRKYHTYGFFSGFTDLQHCYLSAQGFRSKGLYEEHAARNLPILRTGPNAISFQHTRAIKDIYGHQSKCVKDLAYEITSGTHRHLFDVVDKTHHGQKRKLLSAAFAIKNLENWEHKVVFTAQRLFTALDKRCTAPLKDERPSPGDLQVDFFHWINLWTTEAINFITLSDTMDLLDTGTDEVTAEKKDGTLYRARYGHSFRQSVCFTIAFVWDYKLFPWLGRLARGLSSQWRVRYEEGKAFEDVCYHAAAKRLRRHQAGEKLDDFFSCLMEDKNGSPNGLEWGEIVAEISGLINAGADTTATALSNVLEFLVGNPQHLETLREEVDGALDPDETIAPYDKVKNLPFLRACIDEGLRVMPPTSAPLPRRTPPEGARILDEWIPGDTSVSMTCYGAHRDPAVFPDPETYNPHRWMKPEDRRRMEPVFIPFSTGPRGCLGRNISYLEQVIMLASLVHRYDFALPHAGWKMRRVEAFNLVNGEMPIKLWRRTAAC